MDETDILAAFRERRSHYDTYLQANDIQVYTCPGCGFPTLKEKSAFNTCIICAWEDDGLDDNTGSILDELNVTYSVQGMTLKENRINIGRMLDTSAELVDGEVDFDTARVLKVIAYYEQREKDINNRMTGTEHMCDHILLESNEVRKDLQMALIVSKK